MSGLRKPGRRRKDAHEAVMTLLELSKEYRAQSEVLRNRILELQLLWSKTRNERLRDALAERIRILTVMRREAREIAVICERYYERGYRRNERYTL